MLVASLVVACQAKDPPPAPVKPEQVESKDTASPADTAPAAPNAKVQAEEVESSPETAPAVLPEPSDPRLRRLFGPMAGMGGAVVDPGAKRIAFHAGEPGARKVYVAELSGGEPKVVSGDAVDAQDPAWLPDSSALVLSAKGAKDLDLFLLKLDSGELTALSEAEGDELQAVVSPLQYTFSTIVQNDCRQDGESVETLDKYYKVVFTRRAGEQETVRFVSLNRLHQGELSSPSERCHSPAFSHDGLSLSYVCYDKDALLAKSFDASARWAGSLQEAYAAAGLNEEDVVGDWEDAGSGCLDWNSESWSEDPCLAKLPRVYSKYEAKASSAEVPISHIDYSNNQILQLVVRDDGVYTHLRGSAPDAWQKVEAAPAGVGHVVWSPDGNALIFDAPEAGGRSVFALQTDYYLQSVRNLNDFPELYEQRESALLAQNRFVARAGTEKEFYALHEKLRYARRPQFITADVALQVFRDEYQNLIVEAEKAAHAQLAIVCEALFEAFVARYASSKAETDRHFAVYFGVAAVFLRPGVIEPPSIEDFWALDDDDPESPQMQDLLKPSSEKYSLALQETITKLEGLPQAVDSELRRFVELALQHQGISELQVPSYEKPTKVDFSQFAVRGYYGEQGLSGYFLAVSWLSMVPLPLDESALVWLDAMEADDATLFKAWSSVEGLMGAFMGKPVDASPAHLRALRAEQAQLFAPFDLPRIKLELEKARGEVPLRGVDDAVDESEEGYPLRLVFLPKRLGLDVTFFKPLTHPSVKMRGMPSSLDVFAALGVPAAARHAREAVAAEEYAEAYGKALDALIAEHGSHEPGFFGTDIYHSWLAVLLSLATPLQLDEASRLHFARSAAWQDRQLLSALGGYTQLKHAAVLVAMQDMSAECDSSYPVFVLIEQPVLPPVNGYVEPMPEFFDALAALSQRVYKDLLAGTAPETATIWNDGAEVWNAERFARTLAELSRKQLAGQALSEEEQQWIRTVGELVEQLFLAGQVQGTTLAGAGRERRGIAIATDIHTNVSTQNALEIAIGRIMDLYVVVPSEVGERLSQGGIFSFYEFEHSIAERLDDDTWVEMLSSSEPPALPSWTNSFVDPSLPPTPPMEKRY
ncbi:MAG: DUF3160 domain-containing protein [Myxococcota bacterium]|nr:DUF3160 domain-containing protein [Myxococcota bacterium]